jgi:protein-glucosylgalactosylhydroxylysine glucosidase
MVLESKTFSGTQIKRADTILLGYPLMVEMLSTTRNNDLSIYQKVTDSAGPAMTWAMHSIGLLESGDEKSAREMFEKSFSYMLGPFGIWKEKACSEPDRYGCVNFVTGMGRFMQNLLQSYLGLRIHENRLDFTPYVVPNATGFEVHGVNYQGMLFDFMVNTTSVQITLNNQPKSGCAFIDEYGAKMPLKIGNFFTGSIKIKRSIFMSIKTMPRRLVCLYGERK